jgi:ABC-type sugar transport system substrate-binding protein
MNEKHVQDALLSSKADAAFQQAAKKVLQRARQTGTPVVVWEAGNVKEISADHLEKTTSEVEQEDARP